MTHRPIQVLETGTHLYADGHWYKPVPKSKRKYRVNKPDDPRAVRFNGKWFLPLDLVTEAFRNMPATRPFKDPRQQSDPD